jgi:hypothetical protein
MEARMHAFAEWLSSTAPSAAVATTFWLIRLLQAAHLVTAGVAIASGLAIALRVLVLQRASEPFEEVWARFAPWLAASLAVMLLTGAAQVLGDPVRELTATSFWVKVALVLGCAAGTWGLARAVTRTPFAAHESPAAHARSAERLPLAARLAAIALVAAWLLIPMLGRMIAYDKAIWGALSLRP